MSKVKTYQNLGPFSDVITFVKMQHSLFPSADPGKLTQEAVRKCLAFNPKSENPQDVCIDKKLQKDGLAGEQISATSGLSFATQVDPNSGGATPVISQILSMFLTAVFLSVNGHLVALVAIIQSYEALPIGADVNLAALFDAGSWAMRDMLISATKIMLPIVALMTLLNIAIGIITRSAPTLNLFSFGFPITLVSVFLILFLSVPHLGAAFVDLSEQILLGLSVLLQEAKGG